MNAEEAHQLLSQVQLRCLILEAEKDAESLKSGKYRKILDTLTGEEYPDTTQPQAARVLHAAGNALSSSGSGELAIARQPSAHPPVAGRKRNSSSLESTPRRSQRPRLPCSAPRSATAEPRITQETFGVDVAEILERSALSASALELTRAEVACTEETPGIKWSLFSSVFGGVPQTEWPRCAKISGYKDFFCADITAQPFMPLDPGKPGAILRLPKVIETPQDQSTFHVFSSTLHGGALYYRGNYKKVPVPHVPFEWSRLPHRMKRTWLKRATYTSKEPVKRALRARIELRNKNKREPSASEVRAYLHCQFTDEIRSTEIAAAFRSGEEKLILEGIECVRYDSDLAAMIQRAVQASDDDD